MGTVQVTPGQPGQLIIRFSYSPERVAAIRDMPGRRWHSREKHWSAPHSPKSLKRVRRPTDPGESGEHAKSDRTHVEAFVRHPPIGGWHRSEAYSSTAGACLH